MKNQIIVPPKLILGDIWIRYQAIFQKLEVIP